jgi:hypothetical protein
MKNISAKPFLVSVTVGAVISFFYGLLSPLMIGINSVISTRGSPYIGKFSVDFVIYVTLAFVNFLIVLPSSIISVLLLRYAIVKINEMKLAFKYFSIASFLVGIIAFLLTTVATYLYIWLPDESIFYTGKSFLIENRIFFVLLFLFDMITYQKVLGVHGATTLPRVPPKVS